MVRIVTIDELVTSCDFVDQLGGEGVSALTAVVVESFLASKSGDPEGGNDRVLMSPHAFAVIDGASPKGRRDDGQLVADAVVDALASLAPRTGFVDAIRLVNARVSRLGLPNTASSCATFAVFRPQLMQIWRVGDCWVSLDGRVVGPRHTIEDALASVRSVANRALLRVGWGQSRLIERDFGRLLISPALKRLHLFRNHTGKFGHRTIAAIDGRVVPWQLVEVFTLDAATQEVVLASDGYPEVGNTLLESELKLVECIRRDPLMIGECRRTKGVSRLSDSFDDRAYLRLRIRSH